MCVCPRRPQGGEKNRRGRRRGKEDRKDTDNAARYNLNTWKIVPLESTTNPLCSADWQNKVV
jgi:hypothetical protein